MYIEEIVVDGFKSYATRTVIAGFDPTFNAVTGLNGSGKSNILDAICFVLGITNLSQVRVNNLQELVYKQGQAGITKASVTIVFNNQNPKQSPVGYESYERITINRQVVIGGRNKYLINGHTAQVQRVQNLFHSVQLNVNNPHFLIMQGRITKVINMKPPEMLAMIEEAAGTRMYEEKKLHSLRIIEKKSKKVEEIDKILKEDITPTLENLERERTHYSKFIKNQTEIQELSRVSVAYEYVKAKRLMDSSSSGVEQLEKRKEEATEQRKSVEAGIEQKAKKLKEVMSKKEKDMEGGYKQVEKSVEALSKELVKLSSELQHLQENVATEEEKETELQKNVEETKQQVAKKEKELDQHLKTNKKYEDAQKKNSEQMVEYQRQYETLCTGISSDSAGSKTLSKQLMDAEKQVLDCVSGAKQCNMRVEHMTRELKEKKVAAQSIGKEYTELSNKAKALTKSVTQLKEELKKYHYDENAHMELIQNKRSQEAVIMKLREEVEQLQSQVSGLEFRYADPEKNFDRTRVKGLVANLIQVKDPQSSMALEVTAGGKLYNVIVDTEDTAKQLLKNGRLQKRVTILPLNNINRRKVEKNVLSKARDMVGDQAHIALSLVVFDDELEAAMNFVFGNTFVCDNSSIAKKITFHDDIKTRSVTRQGDIFDPAGTLTGGSRAQAGSLLEKLTKVNAKVNELHVEEEKLRDIHERLRKMEEAAVNCKDQKRQYDLKAHELQLLQMRLEQSSHGQLLERCKEIEEELTEAKEAAEENTKKEQEARDLCEDLKSQLKNFSSTREDRMRDLEKRMNALKKEEGKSTKEMKEKQQEAELIRAEIDSLHTESKRFNEEIESTRQTIASMNKSVETKLRETEKKKNNLEREEETLNEKKAHMMTTDKSISALMQEKDNLSKELTDLDIELKKIEHNIARTHKDSKDAGKYVEQLVEKYPWISKEKQFFGKPNTAFDFKARDPEQVQKQLNELQEEQMKLSKQVNKKVMSMFEKAEQEYKDLMNKKAIIEKDKEKIESVIEELDGQKTKALESTWIKVNKDFGSIFSTLLPGTTSKLEIPEGKTLMDGLEMKVAFGGVWKDSLSELSGGQRSLLALSLILSLLLFKPAPMYILDEIDAALDLSHTQNIGQMLKNHFSQSQFIVVSLKEDMFRNANVLFRTKFVEGVSTVTRTDRTKKTK